MYPSLMGGYMGHVVSCRAMTKTSLTIIRYPAWAHPPGFYRWPSSGLPLWMNRESNLFKLMGSGKNGTFDKNPTGGNGPLCWYWKTITKPKPHPVRYPYCTSVYSDRSLPAGSGFSRGKLYGDAKPNRRAWHLGWEAGIRTATAQIGV